MIGHLFFWMSIGLWLLLEAYVFFKLNRKTNIENKEKKSKLIIFTLILIGMFGSIIVDPSVVETFLVKSIILCKILYNAFTFLNQLFELILLTEKSYIQT